MLFRLHDGLQRFAHFGRRGKALRGRLRETAHDDACKVRRNFGPHGGDFRWIGKLNGADALDFIRIRAVERVSARHEFVQDDAEREDIAL